MNKYQIMNAIKDLAMSQGMYARLLEFIGEAEDADAWLEELEAQQFADVVDLVIYLEG